MVWVNEKGERGQPFDLIVLDHSHNVVSYVEVKTTARAEKRSECARDARGPLLGAEVRVGVGACSGAWSRQERERCLAAMCVL